MSIPEKEIEAVLNGPDYIYCERHRCRMSKRACELHSTDTWTSPDCTKCPRAKTPHKRKFTLWYGNKKKTTSKPIQKCSVEGCSYSTRRIRKGLCDIHYQRQRLNAPLNHQKNIIKHLDICSVEGCSQPYYSQGFCKKHYNKQHYNRRTKKNLIKILDNQP